jgi:hypothetical protein
VSEISAEELKERVAVVRRFRELLLAQRERFRVYLDTLEKQKTVIERGNAEDILSHVELEEKMVSDIFSIQKVIAPLESRYRAHASVAEAPDIPEIQTALERLRAEAGGRAKQNRALLERRMSELREELRIARNNPYAKRKPAFAGAEYASFLDLKG